MAFRMIIILLGAVGFSCLSAQNAEDFDHDFNVAVKQVALVYAYLDEKATRWEDMPALYAGDLRQVTTRDHFISLLERVVDELYDHHAHLTVNLETSPRLVPSGTDLWAEWRDGRATITQVRSGSEAERAGIGYGTIVLSIDGIPISEAVGSRLGRSYPDSTTAARNWALRAVLAGRHHAGRILQIEEHGVSRTVDLPSPAQSAGFSETLEASEIRPGIGYIRLNDSLGNSATVAAFDHALETLRQTSGLIVDLRDTPSGGNSSVARGILGRFVDRAQPYQKHVLPSEGRATGIQRSWLELVSPRGDFVYSQPIAVLVNRWTGSMGEGLAIGFDATGAATVVGTEMAGLVGATTRISLPRTEIGINLPSERLYHIDGTPRETFQPAVLVEVGGAHSERDPFIEAALEVLMGGEWSDRLRSQ